jgi:hypothetical protein
MTAPDFIWAWCFNGQDDGSWGEWGGYARQSHLQAIGDREQKSGSVYVRRDPTVLAELPEVQALIAAAVDAERKAPPE